MKLQFNLLYQTTFGENLVLNILTGNDTRKVDRHKMITLDGQHWSADVNMAAKAESFIDYYYSVERGDVE